MADRETSFFDDFPAGGFDRSRWIGAYLPHWSTPDGSAARWTQLNGRSSLTIASDQPAWRADEPEMRVSGIQTAHDAGRIGSDRGQHHHRSGLVVASDTEEPRTLFAQRYGRFETELSAIRTAGVMVAFWLIGADADVERSAEICVAEIFGQGDGRAWEIGVGVHPHGDTSVVDDFSTVTVEEDLSVPHRYAVDWRPGVMRFCLDGREIKVVHQEIRYPMQLMLSLFDFRDSSERRHSELGDPVMSTSYVRVTRDVPRR